MASENESKTSKIEWTADELELRGHPAVYGSEGRKIIAYNCTPHALDFYVGDKVFRVARKGAAIRLTDVDSPSHLSIVTPFGSAPIVHRGYDCPDLPPPVEGVFLIVSQLVAEHYPERLDLLCPDTGSSAVRVDGVIKGVRSLISVVQMSSHDEGKKQRIVFAPSSAGKTYAASHREDRFIDGDAIINAKDLWPKTHRWWETMSKTEQIQLGKTHIEALLSSDLWSRTILFNPNTSSLRAMSLENASAAVVIPSMNTLISNMQAKVAAGVTDQPNDATAIIDGASELWRAALARNLKVFSSFEAADSWLIGETGRAMKKLQEDHERARPRGQVECSLQDGIMEGIL